MRALTAAQQAVWDSGNQAEFVRVFIKDGGGTWRDLTTYPGFNAVKTVTWAEQVDGPHMTCDFVLLREQHKLSLAPFVETSALNKGFDPTAGAVPLLKRNREVKVETAIVAMDRQPGAGDWVEKFTGRVDTINTTGDIRVGCRGKGGRLAQQFIKTELVYSHATVGVPAVAVPLRIWEPQMAVALNSYMLPASRGTPDPGFNKFFKCSQAGTTGTSEPVWTTGANQSDGTAKWDYVAAPTVAGTPVEQVMQNILDDHKAASDAAVTLYVPSSPGWAIKQFIQKREFVLDAVSALAKQIGWDVRYKWRTGTAQFEFTLYEPDRAAGTTHFTFGTGDYENPTKLSQDIAEIRNAWRLIYSDAGDLWPGGQPKRKVIEVSDATSIAENGELWAEIQEDSASNIDSSTEATKLVNAALSDCKEPTADMSVVLTRGFPWVEINDVYAFAANNLHFTSTQTLAVTGWSQSFEAGRLKTTLNLRGKPTIGAATWLERSVHPHVIPKEVPPLQQHFNGVGTAVLAVSQTVGGLVIAASQDQDKSRVTEDELEIHISTTNGFTPDGSSLRGVVRGNSPVVSINDMVPGKTQYAKAVPRSHHKGKIIRGQPSVQKTLAAGRAGAGHLDSLIMTKGPLNGKFQTALDDLTSFPPDHWFVTSGLWGSTREIYYGSDTTNGRYITFRSIAASGTFRSSAWAIPRGVTSAMMIASVRPHGTLTAGRGFKFSYEFFAEETLTTAVGSTQVATAAYNLVGDNVWTEYAATISVPAGANFVRVSAEKESASSAFGWDLGGLYFEPQIPLIVDAWTAVNANGGAAPAFASANWGNNGGGWMPAGFFKGPDGVVHVRGLVKVITGTLTNPIWTFPTGYIPTAGTHQWPLRCGDGTLSYLSLGTNGQLNFGGTLAQGQAAFMTEFSFDTR